MLTKETIELLYKKSKHYLAYTENGFAHLGQFNMSMMIPISSTNQEYIDIFIISHDDIFLLDDRSFTVIEGSFDLYESDRNNNQILAKLKGRYQIYSNDKIVIFIKVPNKHLIWSKY